MTIHLFTGRPRPPAKEGGITHQEAMEMFRRYFVQMQAVPTIAHEMKIEFDTACSVMDGRLWPGVRRHWIDLVLP